MVLHRQFAYLTAGRRLWSSRSGAVALLTALSMVPILGLCGLGIDYAMWSHVYVLMETAASNAALNAVKTAAAGESANDTSYLSEGNLSGAEWFQSEIGGYVSYISSGGLVVNTTGTATVTSTVSFSGTIHSIFGRLFGVLTYPVSGQATSSMSVAPYLQVVMMLDNSSSMDIAATTSGINKLMTLSACDPSNAYYDNPKSPYITDHNQWINQASTDYASYYVGNGFNGATSVGATLSPAVADPVPDTGYPAYVANEYPTGSLTSTGGQSGFPYSYNMHTAQTTGITCQGVLPKQADGLYPLPGPPCAFACHWTTTNSTDARGGTADLFGLARRSGIQLRIDLVKAATNAALNTLNAANIVTYNNLSAGVYTFNSGVTQVYPSNCTPQAFGCEAGSDFSAAETAVGVAPSLPSVTDTGIKPVLAQRTPAPLLPNNTAGTVSDNDNTAFPEAMNNLASNYVTATGDGTVSARPRKVLIIVTDGFQDDPSAAQGSANERRAFDPSYCTQFKTPVAEGGLGYLVYVVYTPYYPVPDLGYVNNGWATIAQGTGSTSISAALQTCSSQSQDPTGTYYLSAFDQTSLTNALNTFVGEALNSPARFTQ